MHQTRTQQENGNLMSSQEQYAQSTPQAAMAGRGDSLGQSDLHKQPWLAVARARAPRSRRRRTDYAPPADRREQPPTTPAGKAANDQNINQSTPQCEHENSQLKRLLNTSSTRSEVELLKMQRQTVACLTESMRQNKAAKTTIASLQNELKDAAGEKG